jgi:phosphoglycolate phosphatase-like HAD superfamily hydrolase
LARVILFDIDNTLLYTGGAGSVAFNETFLEMFGIPDGFARVEFSGRTDRFILEEGLGNHAVEGGAEEYLDEFTRRYYAKLPAALAGRQGYLLPGFPELLGALKDRGARLGLATGNFSEAARIKLEHYGLWGFFEGGGFGEVSVDRHDVVKAAITSVANSVTPGEIAVIGDTPHDVLSGTAHGALGVGVATGRYTAEELLASGAGAVFDDFSDWEVAAAQLLAAIA